MIRARVLTFSAVLAFAGSVGVSTAGLAQVTSETTKTPQSRVTTVDIETAEVVYVSGDDAVLRFPDGSLRLLEVPPGTTFSVDGKPAKVADLTPGSTLTHARVSSRTESEVVTVKQINGRVTAKRGPFVTLRLDDGTSKIYRVPAHATITIDGQPSTLGNLRVGSSFAATAVTTEGLSTVNNAAHKAVQTPPQNGVLVIERSNQSTPD